MVGKTKTWMGEPGAKELHKFNNNSGTSSRQFVCSFIVGETKHLLEIVQLQE